MELIYDWSNFRATFQSNAPRSLPGASAAALKVVAVQGKVAAIAGSFESSPCSWIGKSLEDFKRAHSGQKVQVFEGETVDAWLENSHGLEPNHLYEQMAQVLPPSELGPRPHFLLKAFDTQWAKVFPSSFGVLIRLSDVEDIQARDFFIILKQGRLFLFHRPDLTALGATRGEDLAEVVKYLSEKHSIPVQALGIAQKEWRELSDAVYPWRDLAGLIKANHQRLVPFRWPVVAWIATRAFLK
jgi:hypothetical protein